MACRLGFYRKKMTKAAKQGEDMTNKVFKRAKRSHHTHLPSLEGISLTMTKQPVHSRDQQHLANCPACGT